MKHIKRAIHNAIQHEGATEHLEKLLSNENLDAVALTLGFLSESFTRHSRIVKVGLIINQISKALPNSEQLQPADTASAEDDPDGKEGA